MSSSQFLSSNYADASLVASVVASSEAAGFPKENVIGSTRRTKVWRSAGYFLITEGENTITFEETNGVPLIATIPAGGYDSFNDLASAIKTALDAAGGSVYTVTQDTGTLKFLIESDLAGGDGIFSILWTSSTDMAAILGYNSTADDTGDDAYLADSLKISTGEYFEFDFGMGLNPDAIVVSWRQDELNGINETSTIRVLGNPTNNFVTSQYDQSASKTDYGFVIKKDSLDAEGIADQAYRFWRIIFDDTDNANGFIEIGSIFIGDWIGFRRGCVQFPLNSSWDEETIKTTTDGGQVFFNQKYTTRRFSCEFFALTMAEKEAFDAFYYEVRTGKPFYFLIDPNQVVGSTVERHVVYCRFTSVPSWSLERPGVYNLNVDLREDI